ncbi:MAG: tRNA (adenosine(37)-N6)-threonylcarbamoyltransferase complex dimerization subunit type 1 TsaB [Fimbriiglobus sp.]
MNNRWLLLETTARSGWVALADGGAILRTLPLDPTRRHNRDLAPTVESLLRDAGWLPSQLAGVMVSVGPGSFTGLRVGLISAKMLAYAVGCELIAVPTFAAIAARAGRDVHVISDGLQGAVYCQHFGEVVSELRIRPFADWASELAPGSIVTGPGLTLFETKLPSHVTALPEELRMPDPESLWRAGHLLTPVTRAELMALEPLYLRPSSAEEQAARKAQAAVGEASGLQPKP